MTFRSLRFDQDIRTQVPECPTEMYNKKVLTYALPSTTCWRRANECLQAKNRSLSRCEEPDEVDFIKQGVLPTRAGVEQINGVLGRVRSTIMMSGFGELAAILKEKYGQPTQQEEEPWTSRSGVKVTGLLLRWEWRGLTIVLRGPTDRIELGSFDVWSMQWEKEKEGAEHQRARQGADAL